MSENLNCPFCGTNPQILHDTFAFCDHDGCPIQDHVVPIDVWNRRTPPAIPASVVKRLQILDHEITQNRHAWIHSEWVLEKQVTLETLKAIDCALRELEK